MSEWKDLYNEWFNSLSEGYGVLLFYIGILFLRLSE
tara:strand:+ start:661 stop:768 length:108 start_codon:yes stop_codon:yes gene_type:complete